MKGKDWNRESYCEQERKKERKEECKKIKLEGSKLPDHS